MHTVTLINKTWLTTHLLRLQFKLHSREFSFIPGQFVTLSLDLQGQCISRSYSIANTAERGDPLDIDGNGSPQHRLGTSLTIYVSLHQQGVMSHIFKKAKLGASFMLSQPMGLFRIKKNEARRSLFIATGTGISPMIPMIHSLLSSQHSIELLHGVRYFGDEIMADHFKKLMRDNPFNYRVCYSREQGVVAYPGYVQQILQGMQIKNDDNIYLCGNPNMIKQCMSYLKSIGVPRQRMSFEMFVKQGCVVTINHPG